MDSTEDLQKGGGDDEGSEQLYKVSVFAACTARVARKRKRPAVTSPLCACLRCYGGEPWQRDPGWLLPHGPAAVPRRLLVCTRLSFWRACEKPVKSVEAKT